MPDVLPSALKPLPVLIPLPVFDDDCWTGLGALALTWYFEIWFSWLFFDDCRPVPIALRTEGAPSRLPAGSNLQRGPAMDAAKISALTGGRWGRTAGRR